jgi:hypothetical protein
VTAITATARSAAGPNSSRASKANRREARPHRPNQPMNQHRISVQTGAHQREGDRAHPHESEAERRVHDGGRVRVVDHERYRDRAEAQPHQQGRQAAGRIGEHKLRRATPAGRGAEGQPAAEGSHESVAVHGEGRGVGGRGQHGDARRIFRHPSPAARPPQQPPAGPADRPQSPKLRGATVWGEGADRTAH